MQYLVSFALLVALAAWMVGVYNNLDHLRRLVCERWEQWRCATHRRNVCLADFALVFASFRPQEDPLSHCLQRMSEDSERSLALCESPRWGTVHGFMGGAEQLLRQAVAQSVQTVEDEPAMRGHEQLQELCSSVSASLYRQEQVAALFNHAAREYNQALQGISARFLAPVFGFAAADPLDDEKRQNARSS